MGWEVLFGKTPRDKDREASPESEIQEESKLQREDEITKWTELHGGGRVRTRSTKMMIRLLCRERHCTEEKLFELLVIEEFNRRTLKTEKDG